MANTSILAAFERMWAHVVTKLSEKADNEHTHTAAAIGADPAGSANTALQNAKSYTDTKFTNLVGDTTVATQISNAVSGKADKTDITSHTGNKSNPHGVTLTQLGVTATAAELNALDGITATVTELNYVDGVTSNIQTQLNDKAAKSYVDTQDTATLNSAKSYTDTKVASFVDSAPETLNTLNELAAALGDDPNFATTVATQIGTKADKAYTDTQDTTTLNTAKSYTDTEVGKISTLVGDTSVATQIATAVDDLADTYATKAELQAKTLNVTDDGNGNVTITL